MIIIGLTGGIGHGKTTFANLLTQASPASGHWESSDVITQVANALRSASPAHPDRGNISAINHWLEPLADVLANEVHIHVTAKQLRLGKQRLKSEPALYTKLFEYLADMQANPALQQLTITTENKASFRSLQQWLGGYLVLQFGGIWFDEIVRQIQAAPGIELAVVGGVRFPGDEHTLHQAGGQVMSIIRPEMPERYMTDLTERERHEIKIDTQIYNDGDLNQLAACAVKVFKDLKSGSLAAYYHAATFLNSPALNG